MIARNMDFRRQAQEELRESMAFWFGLQREVHDRSDSDSFRRFYHTFGIDALTAQGLGRADAERLTTLIRGEFT